MYIDTQNILCKSKPANNTKIYKQIVDGYNIQDYDKTLFVYHKKQIKEIQLKDLGNNMSIFYISNKLKNIKNKIESDSFLNILNIFQGFDEETGENYVFLPKFTPNRIKETNRQLTTLGIKIQLEKSDKGIIITNFQKHKSTDIASMLFGLAFFYGKFEIQNKNIKAIKAHIPLFGQYLNQKEFFDTQIKKFQKEGIFIKTKTQENKDGIIYQFIISDYEILQSFANFLKPIAKVEKISKYEYMEEAKEKLLKHNKNLSSLLKDKMIKLLTK